MRSLVIKATVGVEAPERLNQAFSVAAAAIAMGAEVSLWLTGEATWLALPGRAEQFSLPHAPALAGARDLVLESGFLMVCSSCAARRDLQAGMLLPGARIAGSAEFAEAVLGDGVQALVY